VGRKVWGAFCRPQPMIIDGMGRALYQIFGDRTSGVFT